VNQNPPVIDLVLNVNKPIGWTSNDVIRRLKSGKKYKIGHAGTLDPFADGVLLICIGKGTKRVPQLMECEKEYKALFELGTETDSLDICGKIERQESVPKLGPDVLNTLSEHFSGELLQTPPVFSAVRINGKRAYERARNGEQVKPKSRKVQITSLTVKALSEKLLDVHVTCSKGTYIRALARDMAEYLGTVGFVRKLTRVRVGDYHINDAKYITQASDILRTQI